MSARYRLLHVAELDASLLASWRAIQAGSVTFASPYFSPEFTQAVAHVRGDVRVLLIENQGRPVGFFPHQRQWPGRGRPVGGPLSDYHGIVAEPGADWSLDEVMRAAGLAVWPFDHLVGDPRFDPCAIARATSPQIDLSLGYERYAQGRREAGSEYVVKTEALARKLGRDLGELSFTLHEPDPGALAQLLGWKRDQYRAAGTADVFGVRWTGALLERLASIQTEEFAGLCSVLRVGGRVVASHMGIRSRAVLHYWFPAYDPALSKYSTGIILLLRIARAVAEAGVRTIDLGKGDSQYKERLMTGAAELREGMVARPSLAAGAWRLRRAVEVRAAGGGAWGTSLRLPLRLARRLDRMRRFR